MKKLIVYLTILGVTITGYFALVQSVSSKTPPGLEKRPTLEKKVFIHYRRGAKPPWAGGGKPGKEPKCYGFLGRGVSWKGTPVDYMIDPKNPDGLEENFITSAISASAEEWDNYTDIELFNDYQLIDNGSWDGWQGSTTDGRSELLFGVYPDESVIAVTVIWGYFSGPPGLREILEFDVLFNTYYPWGNGELDKMDLQNIATHELGHGIGLDDVYDTACAEVTMYGYSDYGEIKKRTLEAPDIEGLLKLY